MTQDTPRTGQVIAFRNDRLGGRLMMIVNAMRMARMTEGALAVHWHQGTDVSADINDPTQFFDPAFVDDHFIDRQTYTRMRDGAVRPQERRGMDVAGFRALLDAGTNILVDEAFGITAFAGEDPVQAARHGAAIWRAIPLAAPVAGALARIRDTIGPDTTAYHIRRGDILSLPRAMHRAWPNKYIYDELYQTHIEATLKNGARPVLFCDDPATIARFCSRYPALIPAGSLFDASSVTPGQADFLEMLALASCSRIVAPPQSAFSSGAASLGEVPICDVETDLTDEQRSRAGQRLFDRLRHPAKAGEPRMEQGDIGQSLLHLERVLRGRDRLPEAVATIRRHLRGGLDTSFLFPKLIELQLETGDIAGARASGAMMQTRDVFHRPDYARGQILHCLAHLDDGPGDLAIRLAHIAHWHDPAASYVCEAIGGFYATGILNDTNALPLSPAAARVWERPMLKLPRFADTKGRFAALRVDTLGRPIAPSPDPLQWDWAPFMRSFPRGALARHRHRHVYERGLARLATALPGPDTASLTAIYDMHVAERDDWLPRLHALARDHPGDAMVQHRLSLAATVARDFKTASAAAEAAVDAAPEVPAHIAWRAASQQRARRYRMAMGDLRSGIAAGLGIPRLHQRLAEVAALAGNDTAHKAALDAAIGAAPREVPLRMARATWLHAAGRPKAALADLDVLLNFEAPLPGAVALHAICLSELDAAQPLAHASIAHPKGETDFPSPGT